VFSLYEYIIACASPDECEQDVQLLERIGAAMDKASTSLSDFTPLARTINALNKVTRTIQDERRRAGAGSDSVHGGTTNGMPDFDLSALASFPDFPFNFDDATQPLGFVRALENDFMGRNWHEGWWDAGAGLDDSMTGLEERYVQSCYRPESGTVWMLTTIVAEGYISWVMVCRRPALCERTELGDGMR
jgi:hypothetical protein